MSKKSPITQTTTNLALAEAVRLGLVTVTKDSEGRDVYHPVRVPTGNA